MVKEKEEGDWREEDGNNKIVRSIGVLFLGVEHIAVCAEIFSSLLPVIYKGH
ncbi:hypothetical protein IMY05_002G0109700 [Salix suchowensis]|nr:hypothetical protein IMY05_002G0109700 [Salix suchowensis]